MNVTERIQDMIERIYENAPATVVKALKFVPKPEDKRQGSMLVTLDPNNRVTFWARIGVNNKGYQYCMTPSWKRYSEDLDKMQYTDHHNFNSPSVNKSLYPRKMNKYVKAGLIALWNRHVLGRVTQDPPSNSNCGTCDLCTPVGNIPDETIADKRNGIVQEKLFCMAYGQFIDTKFRKMLLKVDTEDNGEIDGTVKVRYDGATKTYAQFRKELLMAGDCNYYVWDRNGDGGFPRHDRFEYEDDPSIYVKNGILRKANLYAEDSFLGQVGEKAKEVCGQHLHIGDIVTIAFGDTVAQTMVIRKGTKVVLHGFETYRLDELERRLGVEQVNIEVPHDELKNDKIWELVDEKAGIEWGTVLVPGRIKLIYRPQ